MIALSSSLRLTFSFVVIKYETQKEAQSVRVVSKPQH